MEVADVSKKGFCLRKVLDNDDLPRILESKEGSVEQEPLSDELALSASGVMACKDYARLAERMGEVQAHHEAEQWGKKRASPAPKAYMRSRIMGSRDC